MLVMVSYLNTYTHDIYTNQRVYMCAYFAKNLFKCECSVKGEKEKVENQ